MNQLQAMRVFLSVAAHGSFGRAAASLNLSNAVVTRYVALLEAHLKTRLVNRNTRSVSLTEAGTTYAQGCRQVLDDLEHIETQIAHGVAVPSGTLRLVAHASFSINGLTPLLQRFLATFPQVRANLTLLHRPVDLIEEGFDAGIVAPRQVSGETLIRRPLVTITPIAVAAPAYLETHGVPHCPADLATHALVAPSADIHGEDWLFEAPDGACNAVRIEPVYAVNDAVMQRQAALAGMGIAILSSDQVAADLASGAVVRVLDGYAIRDADKELALVYPGRRHVPAKTRAFVDFTVGWFRNLAESRQEQQAQQAQPPIPDISGNS
jgi:DNA-binding transcriptional LysR family regulator